MKEKISDLFSGERETGDNLYKIHKESLYRYNLVRDYFLNNSQTKKLNGLDIFCGNGYGSYFLGRFIKNISIDAVDGCKDAIKMAKKYYKYNNISYSHKVYPFLMNKNKYDFVVCFESIEHINDSISFLSDIYKSMKDNSILFLSTPNEDYLPIDKCLSKFHKKQYTRSELINILENIGFSIEEQYGQNIFTLSEDKSINGYLPAKQRNILNDLNSQNMIFICRKK